MSAISNEIWSILKEVSKNQKETSQRIAENKPTDERAFC